MRVVIAGASGFLGSHLARRLTVDGHEVVRLVRRPTRGPDERRWNPSREALDPAVLTRADAVVNMAGASVGAKRWTARYKQELLRSRVDTTATLAVALAACPAGSRPAALLNASAEGWYGDTGEAPVDEDAPAGEGFLADLCRVWEAATRPAEDVGVRVVRLRTGLVLDRSGGFLKPLMLPFTLGLGARFASGRQWMPWISLADWISAVRFLLDRDDLAGPVNVTGPEPVTNAEFAKEFAAALRRPAVLAIPAVVLRVVLGEFASESLRSCRMLPGALKRAGYTWQHPDLRSALRVAVAAGQPALGV